MTSGASIRQKTSTVLEVLLSLQEIIDVVGVHKLKLQTGGAQSNASARGCTN